MANPNLLIDRHFVVVSASDDHIHLRELGTGVAVDVRVGWDGNEPLEFLFNEQELTMKR